MIEVHDYFLTIGLIYQRIVNDELVVTGFEESSESVMVAAVLYRLWLGALVADAVRLVDWFHW